MYLPRDSTVLGAAIFVLVTSQRGSPDLLDRVQARTRHEAPRRAPRAARMKNLIFAPSLFFFFFLEYLWDACRKSTCSKVAATVTQLRGGRVSAFCFDVSFCNTDNVVAFSTVRLTRGTFQRLTNVSRRVPAKIRARLLTKMFFLNGYFDLFSPRPFAHLIIIT